MACLGLLSGEGFVGGHFTRGLAPPGPPFAHPRWLRVSPAFWVPLVAWLLRWAARPLFSVSGGTSPRPPGMGLRPLHPRFNQGRRRPTFFKEADFSQREGGTSPHPLDPHLPTLVGLGFANVLGPTRGGVAKGQLAPPPPHAPRHGGFAPWTPHLPTLVGFGFASVLGPTRVANVATRSLFFVLGAHPPTPLGWGWPSPPPL